MPSVAAELVFLRSWHVLWVEEKVAFAFCPQRQLSSAHSQPQCPCSVHGDRCLCSRRDETQCQGRNKTPRVLLGLPWERPSVGTVVGAAQPDMGTGRSPWGVSSGEPMRVLTCELPPALLRITQVLPPLSEKLTSNKRAL